MTFLDLRRSPIRWAGSKRKLLPEIIARTPLLYSRYVEPFCGSLCLFVELRPQCALVADMNPELMHFYASMRRSAAAVAREVHTIPTDDATYYRIREIDPASLSRTQRAARFLYLNRFCFNGVYRTNLQGGFNVSRGSHMGEIPGKDELTAFGALLKNADLKCSDFEKILDNCGVGDYVYLDPPYAGREVRDRGEYGIGAFKSHDLPRFADKVKLAATRGAKVLISYADLPRIRQAFADWNIEEISVSRHVSGFTTGRCKVNELIIRNYK